MRAVVNVGSQVKTESSDDNISLPKNTTAGPTIEIKQFIFLYFSFLFLIFTQIFKKITKYNK